MFPRHGLSGVCYRLLGENFFWVRVRNNLLSQMIKVKNGRTHTYLSNNAQTEDGVSHNAGAERFYTWQNTIVDCREMPNISQSAFIEGFVKEIEDTSAFHCFYKELEERSGGFLKAAAFVKVIQGQKNKRYNIRLESKSKYEEFDIVRTGLRISANSPEDFKMGLFHLLNWEKRNHADYRGMLILPEKAPA